ncbi:hypothetical protein EZV62_001591 [Acer yangbiense]|uniref:Uncharacterized protein n=1 Tax=Acer yangbiense TaxID=1000413 RepID=A0A5C7IWW8_9ROSI|nr:hypothetical protein EZV62_001591 [Acer yangbiense]
MKFFTSWFDTSNRNILSLKCSLMAFWDIETEGCGYLGMQGLWKVKAGGAYTLNTTSVVTARSTIRSLSEKTES